MPEISKIRQWINEQDVDVLILEPDWFDEAILGLAGRCAMEPVIVYSTKKCIEVLMKQGMTHEEAVEYFDFNTRGAYVGENGPLFLDEPEEF